MYEDQSRVAKIPVLFVVKQVVRGKIGSFFAINKTGIVVLWDSRVSFSRVDRQHSTASCFWQPVFPFIINFSSDLAVVWVENFKSAFCCWQMIVARLNILIQNKEQVSGNGFSTSQQFLNLTKACKSEIII